MKKEIQEVIKAWNEGKSGQRLLLEEVEEDFRFYLSDQWSSDDKKLAEEKGVPALNINYVKKTVDQLSGFQRQNRSALVAKPIEGSDEMTAEVISKVLRWSLTDRNSKFVISDTYQDALICGLGWLHPYLVYDKDPIDGDIKVKKVSPLNIMFDPYTTEPDLSDCDYLIRWQKLSKLKLKELYPKYKKQIEDKKGSKVNDDIIRDIDVTDDLGNKLLVIEYWYRKYKEVTLLVNLENISEYQVFEGTKEELALIKSENPNIKDIKHRIPEIRLRTVIEKEFIVFDDVNPYGLNEYPFIPMFAFYEQSFPDWDLKVSGLIRSLKDPQREKNKRRSNIMQSINTMIRTGYIQDKGAFDDVNELREAAMYGGIASKNPGRSVERITPPPIDNAVVQLEMMADNDINMIGANPELRGYASEKGAPGIVVQARQRAGVMAVQKIDDNKDFALIALGNQAIQYILGFSEGKIKRILGEEAPFLKEIQELTNALQAMQAQPPQVDYDPSPDDRELAANVSEEDADVLGDIQIAEQRLMQEKVEMQAMQQMQQMAQQLQQLTQQEQQFWAEFDDKRGARYDVVIDKTADSQTYRQAMLDTLTQMGQYKIIDPMILQGMMLEYMDISKDLKDKWREGIGRMQQVQPEQPAP